MSNLGLMTALLFATPTARVLDNRTAEVVAHTPTLVSLQPDPRTAVNTRAMGVVGGTGQGIILEQSMSLGLWQYGALRMTLPLVLGDRDPFGPTAFASTGNPSVQLLMPVLKLKGFRLSAMVSLRIPLVRRIARLRHASVLRELRTFAPKTTSAGGALLVERKLWKIAFGANLGVDALFHHDSALTLSGLLWGDLWIGAPLKWRAPSPKKWSMVITPIVELNGSTVFSQSGRASALYGTAGLALSLWSKRFGATREAHRRFTLLAGWQGPLLSPQTLEAPMTGRWIVALGIGTGVVRAEYR